MYIAINFLWLILSYLIGSIPFGYLISKAYNKNILETGWRKTSGSNVFRNVGKLQGILTGILDLGKGYLVVYSAKELGFSSEFQILAGVAVVTGHNWSIFLKFAGGRGIGTFIGAFLALSPQLLLFSIIPLIIFAIIWNASIGTLLFLATAILLSIYSKQFDTGGIFTVLSLVPILIKRLSPIGEIKKSQDRSALIRNRLIFDNDEFLHSFRINRIFQKENPRKLSLALKIITTPVFLSSKVGWKAAKFGVEAVKKPIEKLVSMNQEKTVTEIKIEDFKEMMIAASKKIVLHQEEINKINVFPVADRDTGYNLAATLIGIEGVISQKHYSTFRELTDDMKEAAMINARGNAGMIITGYFIEVLDRIKHLESVDAFHLALSLEKGIKAAKQSIINPIDGTILDVIKAAGDKAFELTRETKGKKSEKNIIKILESAHNDSLTALALTKEKLEVLKQNNVVDAGALGFVKIFEAWLESLKGVKIVSQAEPAAIVQQSTAPEEALFQYEVILSFKNIKEFQREDLKNELSLLGDSLDIIELEGKIKLHIHTNQPDFIKEKFNGLPELDIHVEDIIERLKNVPKKYLGLIVDEVADLPKEFLEKYGIEEVPFRTKFPDGEIITSKEEIYIKMREALKTSRPLPTTAAPSFNEFHTAYQKALRRFEKILVITVSSKLSGAYSAARIARSIFTKPEKLNIIVFDCFTAEVGEGLIAMRAQELISQGKKIEEILDDLKSFCPKINLLACLDDFRYVVRGGRVRLPRLLIKPISLMQKIGIRPLIGLRNGRVKFLGISVGKDIAKILTEEIDKQRGGRKIKAAIAHADNFKSAEELKSELEKKSGIEVLFISSVSPVVGTHTGPGALITAFYPVELDS